MFDSENTNKHNVLQVQKQVGGSNSRTQPTGSREHAFRRTWAALQPLIDLMSSSDSQQEGWGSVTAWSVFRVTKLGSRQKSKHVIKWDGSVSEEQGHLTWAALSQWNIIWTVWKLLTLPWWWLPSCRFTALRSGAATSSVTVLASWSHCDSQLLGPNLHDEHSSHPPHHQHVQRSLPPVFWLSLEPNHLPKQLVIPVDQVYWGERSPSVNSAGSSELFCWFIFSIKWKKINTLDLDRKGLTQWGNPKGSVISLLKGVQKQESPNKGVFDGSLQSGSWWKYISFWLRRNFHFK